MAVKCQVFGLLEIILSWNGKGKE